MKYEQVFKRRIPGTRDVGVTVGADRIRRAALVHINLHVDLQFFSVYIIFLTFGVKLTDLKKTAALE